MLPGVIGMIVLCSNGLSTDKLLSQLRSKMANCKGLRVELFDLDRRYHGRRNFCL